MSLHFRLHHFDLAYQQSHCDKKRPDDFVSWHMDISYNNRTAPIYLPGTLTDAHLGDSCTLKPCMQKEIFLNLKAKYNYIGVATYSKTVFIPKGWKKHNIILHFDRTL